MQSLVCLVETRVRIGAHWRADCSSRCLHRVRCWPKHSFHRWDSDRTWKATVPLSALFRRRVSLRFCFLSPEYRRTRRAGNRSEADSNATRERRRGAFLSRLLNHGGLRTSSEWSYLASDPFVRNAGIDERVNPARAHFGNELVLYLFVQTSALISSKVGPFCARVTPPPNRRAEGGRRGWLLCG
jgi:hypothetical protein